MVCRWIIITLGLFSCVSICHAESKLQQITATIKEQVHLEDRALGIRGEEHQAYYEVLRQLLELPVGELEQAAKVFLGQRFKRDFTPGIPREIPVYAHMHFHLKEYHGQPVMLRGHTQRIIPIDIDPPVAGLTKLYEIWLYTDDSQRNPTVVIAPGLPEEYTTGDTIQDHLKVTGVLFKKYLYKAQDQVRFAPLILAGELSYDPPTYQSLKDKPTTLIIASLYVILFVTILYFMIIFLQKKKPAYPASSGLPGNLEEFQLSRENLD